jgi:prophage regulatory protein
MGTEPDAIFRKATFQSRRRVMRAETPTSPDRIRVMRLPEVMRVTGIRRTLIYRLQAESRFPHSVKITDYAVGWLEAEVNAWIAERVASRRDARGPRPGEGPSAAR